MRQIPSIMPPRLLSLLVEMGLSGYRNEMQRQLVFSVSRNMKHRSIMVPTNADRAVWEKLSLIEEAEFWSEDGAQCLMMLLRVDGRVLRPIVERICPNQWCWCDEPLDRPFVGNNFIRKTRSAGIAVPVQYASEVLIALNPELLRDYREDVYANDDH